MKMCLSFREGVKYYLADFSAREVSPPLRKGKKEWKGGWYPSPPPLWKVRHFDPRKKSSSRAQSSVFASNRAEYKPKNASIKKCIKKGPKLDWKWLHIGFLYQKIPICLSEQSGRIGSYPHPTLCEKYFWQKISGTLESTPHPLRNKSSFWHPTFYADCRKFHHRWVKGLNRPRCRRYRSSPTIFPLFRRCSRWDLQLFKLRIEHNS